MNDRQATMLTILESDPLRGFDGAELERRCGFKNVGVTADWLVRHGYATSFIGGTGPLRTFWQRAHIADNNVQ